MLKNSIINANVNHLNILVRISEGQRPAQIAEALNISKQLVSNVKNSKEGKEILNLLMTKRVIGAMRTAELIGDLVPLAIENLINFLVSPAPDIRFKATIAVMEYFNKFTDKFPEGEKPIGVDKVARLKRHYLDMVKKGEDDGILPVGSAIEEAEEVNKYGNKLETYHVKPDLVNQLVDNAQGKVKTEELKSEKVY